MSLSLIFSAFALATQRPAGAQLPASEQASLEESTWAGCSQFLNGLVAHTSEGIAKNLPDKK